MHSMYLHYITNMSNDFFSVNPGLLASCPQAFPHSKGKLGSNLYATEEGRGHADTYRS
jgi:hypothetical protein